MSMHVSLCWVVCLGATSGPGCQGSSATPAEMGSTTIAEIRTKPVNIHPEVPSDAAGALSEEQTLELARRVIVASSPERARCLDFFLESRTDEVSEVGVRERHDAACGGDPDVAPIAERLRVTADGRVARYDAVEDRWSPVAEPGSARAAGPAR